jgi:hypothetical protein
MGYDETCFLSEGKRPVNKFLRALIQVDGDGAPEANTSKIQLCIVAQNFNPCLNGPQQFRAVRRVDVNRGFKSDCIHSLDHKKHHRTVAVADFILEFPKMLQAPCRDRVREKSRAVFNKRAILYFHKAWRLSSGQKDVYPGVRSIFNLGSNLFIACQFGDQSCPDGSGNQAVGHQGVDSYKRLRHLDHFPGIGMLAARALMQGKIDGPTRLRAAFHASAVRAMGRNNLSIRERHISKESPVALDQRSRFQFRPTEEAIGIKSY